MRICEVNFGGEVGTRPAVIVKSLGNYLEVMKITTKAKASDYSRFRLSGFSGVRGYVVTNMVYTISKDRVKRYTSNLFDYERKGAINKMNIFDRQGKLERIIIS